MTDSTQPASGRAGRAIALYIVGVFVAAAVTAPWLYRGVRAASVHLAVLMPLTAHPLHRYVQRLLLVFAVVGLPTLLRTLGLRRWRDLGLGHPRRHTRVLAIGALVGAATILAAAAIPLAAGARVIDPAATPERVALRLLTAVIVAPVVALLEEVLFRGVLDGGLRRAGASVFAIAASSAFYAAVHFLARPVTPATVTWSSGLVAVGGMLAGLGDVDALVPAFFSLWLVGAYLGALYQRTGTLLASVGVHAGGIFVLQLYGLVTTDRPGANTEIWGTGHLIDGWAALAVLFGAGALGRLARARTARAIVAARAEVDEAGAMA